ncbi:MAG: sulfite exporter TauE/SafE family protein [Pseudomonadota bacterium]
MDPIDIAFACLAVGVLGIAKGGFGGVGTPAALPIMALGVEAELALGALLPLLIAIDAVSVSAHRKNADIKAVSFGLPAALFGIIAGAYLIAIISSDLTGGVIGALSILFAVIGLTGYLPRIDGWPVWTNSIFAAVSGLTSTLAHAGGPPIHIYYLARGYDTARFVATSAMFMAGMNLIKVVPFIVVGALNTDALWLALALAPLAILSAALGVVVSRRISKRAFSVTVNTLMLLVGAKLIFDALT